jgi:plasmid stabilization system protein ParE
MKEIVWTRRAIEDVQGIRRSIEQDSPHFARLVATRVVAAVERLARFPQSGRVVPEIGDPALREVIHGPYRVVYRLVDDQVHIVTVHHSARLFNLEL